MRLYFVSKNPAIGEEIMTKRAGSVRINLERKVMWGVELKWAWMLGREGAMRVAPKVVRAVMQKSENSKFLEYFMILSLREKIIR